MLAGTFSGPALARATAAAAAAIPGARIHRVAGHGHFAHRSDPALVTAVICDFAASDDQAIRTRCSRKCDRHAHRVARLNLLGLPDSLLDG